MSNVVRLQPVKLIDAAQFEGRQIPKRNWLIEDMLLRGSVTMLNGDGGVGKSLLTLQMQVAAALGQPWLGIPMPDGGLTTLGLYCEDDEDELHRRLASILEHYQASFADVAGRILLLSRVGENNELMRFGFKNDVGQPTALFAQIENLIRLHNVQLTILDTVADIFMGNENIRPQVRGFITAIRKLSLINSGGVVITAHPSRAGMADGTGLSGSTGWNGSVRSRIYLTKPKVKDGDLDGEEGQTDERILKTMKSNYGAAGDRIRLKWERGVFVRTDNVAASRGVYDRLDDDRRVLEAAKWLIDRGEKLTAAMEGRSSLHLKVRNLPSMKDMAFKDIWAAQERMIGNGRMVIVELGPPSKRLKCVRPNDVRYSGEDEDAT